MRCLLGAKTAMVASYRAFDRKVNIRQDFSPPSLWSAGSTNWNERICRRCSLSDDYHEISTGEVITLISAIHMHIWMLGNSEFALELLPWSGLHLNGKGLIGGVDNRNRRETGESGGWQELESLDACTKLGKNHFNTSYLKSQNSILSANLFSLSPCEASTFSH